MIDLSRKKAKTSAATNTRLVLPDTQALRNLRSVPQSSSISNFPAKSDKALEASMQILYEPLHRRWVWVLQQETRGAGKSRGLAPRILSQRQICQYGPIDGPLPGPTRPQLSFYLIVCCLRTRQYLRTPSSLLRWERILGLFMVHRHSRPRLSFAILEIRGRPKREDLTNNMPSQLRAIKFNNTNLCTEIRKPSLARTRLTSRDQRTASSTSLVPVWTPLL